jgi:hypothetical protein
MGMFNVKQFLQLTDANRFPLRMLDAELTPNKGCSIPKGKPSRLEAAILARLCSK